jgi:hypothetical protein
MMLRMKRRMRMRMRMIMMVMIIMMEVAMKMNANARIIQSPPHPPPPPPAAAADHKDKSDMSICHHSDILDTHSEIMRQLALPNNSKSAAIHLEHQRNMERTNNAKYVLPREGVVLFDIFDYIIKHGADA